MTAATPSPLLGGRRRGPAGTSILELSYGPDGWDRTGVSITVLTGIGLVAWALARARRRRRS